MTVRPRQVAPSLLHLDAIIARLHGRAALTEVCRFLRSEFPSYRWVGIYRKDGEELRLEAWDGERPTEHTVIPIDRGVCGRAVRENAPVIVRDVRDAPEYLACFLETRAEIVVPIRRDEASIGEIDVDGNEVGAFDESDAEFLSRVAAKLGPLIDAAATVPWSPP